MQSNPSVGIPKSHRIGVRLNLVLLGILIFFIASCGYAVWALQKQADQFQTLTQVHYDRAMLAAELSRDAELIATQALERSVTQQLGNVDANILQTDITRIFSVAREKLTAYTPKEADILAEIDQLTPHYFQQLIRSYELLEAQQRLEQTLTRKKHILETVDASLFEKRMFLELSNATFMALQTSSPGAMARRTQELETLLQRFEPHTQANLQTVAAAQTLTTQIRDALAVKTELDQLRPEALSAMREARLQAQRLSGICYDLYLLVKVHTAQAAQDHQKQINAVTAQITLFSALFVFLMGLTYWLIHRYIVRRLNVLTGCIEKHRQGIAVSIPKQGQDEIALIGKTFAAFVETNNQAKIAASESQKQMDLVNHQLRTLNLSLLKQSHTDELTQIANRRFFFSWLEDMHSFLHTTQQPLSLFMIDIDWFKAYNDFYGHQAGDECLKLVAQTLNQVVGETDGLLGRYGGEEFIIAIQKQTYEQTLTLGKKLLTAINEAKIEHQGSPLGTLSISVGMAFAPVGNEEHAIAKLISKADNALYEAKSKGRAQLAVHSSIASSPTP